MSSVPISCSISCSAATDRLIAIGQFVGDIASRQDGPQLILASTSSKPPLNSALASSQFFLCSVIHSKCLSLSVMANNTTDGDVRKKERHLEIFLCQLKSE
jgi:hypothetical protein